MKLLQALSKKAQKIILSRWLPWTLLGGFFIVTLVNLILRPAFIRSWHLVTISSLILLGLLFVFLFLFRLMDLDEQRERLQLQLVESNQQVAQAYHRLEAIFQVGQKLVEATDENEVIALFIRLSIDLTGAKGASFVPLDEHGHPMASTSSGDLPLPLMEPWFEYLASPAVRDRCQSCDKQNMLASSCPLLKGPLFDVPGIYCLPLRRGDREFGVLNLYMPSPTPFDRETQSFFGAMIDETALALEAVRLRRREVAAIRQMQTIRQKADLHAKLNSMLESVYSTLDSSLAYLFIKPQIGASTPIKISLSEIPIQPQPFIDNILQGVIASGEPVILGDVTGESASKSGVHSFLAAPLISSERDIVGGILIGNKRAQGFNQRQLTVLQTIAGQFTLVVENTNLVTELEYQAMMEERKRLAREIHDGLAQTLGFLKLQAAQMKIYLAREDLERARMALDQYYSALSEAYLDARQAIDGLRIDLGEDGMRQWLDEIVSDFMEVSDLSIRIRRFEVNSELAPEVHAQLMRIVQEALSNVRKHSRACQVWIDCGERDGDLLLEVEDDGEGFSLVDVAGNSRHGLQGMRERADLIGADFQIVNQPGHGTKIIIRLPTYIQRTQETPL
jgi:two-component system, NarL family, nitrate/nitrite sensor histidine kinase NarX